jgi:hypothetical protein
MSTTETVATETTVEIAELFTEDVYRPLGLRKVVNQVLKGIDPEAKELPGPMFYTYCNKGYIPNEDRNIKREDAIAWTEKYLAKRFA